MPAARLAPRFLKIKGAEKPPPNTPIIQLFGVINNACFADDRRLDLPRIFKIALDLFHNVMHEHSRARIIQQAATRYAALLEQQCREAPLQWYNFYDFWNDDEKHLSQP